MSEQKSMRTVSVIGLGAMGSAIARAFLRNGHRVTVWNRTASRIRPLEEAGAKGASAVAQAVAASDVIVISVLDYQVSRSLLDSEEVAHDFRGKVLVQLTTGTPQDARDLAAWAHQYDIRYLDGAILGYPNGIGTPEGSLIYSGSAEAFEANRELLQCLGSNTFFLGTVVASASILDLCLLNLYYLSSFAFMQSMALCEAEGYPFEAHTEASRAILPVISDTIKTIGAMALQRNYQGEQAALEVHAAAYQLIAKQLRAHHIDGGITEGVQQSFERALATGRNREELGALFEALRKPSAS